MSQQVNNKVYTSVKWSLFIILLVYLLLRVFLNETLHDEVASYMYYFYLGDFWGENMHWDANNHLLNSFLGHHLYNWFGDQFWILRLPNALAFVLYFWGSVRLTKNLKTPHLKLFGLIALTTIPYVFEYFGYARGYGLSMGLFIWSLSFFLRHLKEYNFGHLIAGYIFLGLSITASLTLLTTGMMIMVLMIFYPIMTGRSMKLIQRVLASAVHFGFIFSIYPLIDYGFALKEKGALYYGSLDGIWDVTGKSLSKYALFYEADWLMYLYIILFVFIGGVVLRFLVQEKFSQWIKQPIVLYASLFFGNIAAILLMSIVMEVNYPEDRAALHLIPLFLLLLFEVLDRISLGKYIQWGFLLFPISFALHLSIHTSVFSPDDRMDAKFYQSVKEVIEPQHSIMIYPIMNWNWPYNESHQTQKASVAQFDNYNTLYSDIIVTKTTMMTETRIPELYDTIAYHAPSTYIAFKRKQPLIVQALDTVKAADFKGKNEFREIAVFNADSLEGKSIRLSISGHLKTHKIKNRISMVVETKSEEGSTIRYNYYSFEAVYQGQLIDDDFLHHFVLENLAREEKQIKVYLWNRGDHSLELSQAECVLNELILPENESR